MDIKNFQELSIRTINKDLNREQLIANMVFGINGEVGEVTDILKKHLYHSHPLDEQHLSEEIGDVMFYIVNLSNIFGFDMEHILQNNIDKLKKRFPDGFDVEKSINRK